MVKLDHWAKRQASHVSRGVARILAPRPAEARQRAQAGYSLMEVLIAVAIIATLAALVAPRLFGQLDSSKQAAALTQIRMVETALDTMRLDLGRSPDATRAVIERLVRATLEAS